MKMAHNIQRHMQVNFVNNELSVLSSSITFIQCHSCKQCINSTYGILCLPTVLCNFLQQFSAYYIWCLKPSYRKPLTKRKGKRRLLIVSSYHFSFEGKQMVLHIGSDRLINNRRQRSNFGYIYQYHCLPIITESCYLL